MANTLSCRVQLSQFSAALQIVIRSIPTNIGLQQSAYLLELKSDGEHLTLKTCNGDEEITVSIPCQGDDFCLLVSATQLQKHVFKSKGPKEYPLVYYRGKRSQQGKLVLPPHPTLPPPAKPPEEGHNEFGCFDEEKFGLYEFGPIPRKSRIEITPTPSEFFKIMEYLWLARNPKIEKPITNGLMFVGDKLALTDGHRLHAQLLGQSMQISGVLPKASTEALYFGLKYFEPESMRVQYAHSRTTNCFVIFLPGECSVRINAKAIEVPEKFYKVCPPLEDGLNIGVTAEPLAQLLNTVIKLKLTRITLQFSHHVWRTDLPPEQLVWDPEAKAFSKSALLYFYEVDQKDEQGKVTGTLTVPGMLPSHRSGGSGLVKVRSYDPKYLSCAIETMGGFLGLLLPWVRIKEGEHAGEDDDEYYPLVITGRVEDGGVSGRYAVVMPLR